ncbi:MAG TPA: ABC transporter permease [Candidatus Polarisedimenticolia bacterium]|nr:ABC transporter permease [Candidatus Polarisedimenticolia bacterium]
MTSYLLRRLLSLVPVLLAAATIVWIFVFLLPGDPARLIAGGQGLDPQVLQSIRMEWGLDRPVPAQYLGYLGKLLRGDLGISSIQRRPVADIIRDHFPPTFILALAALLLSATSGLLLGALAAFRQGGFLDNLVLVVALLGTSTPVFWLGLMLMLLFASRLEWLPVLGYGMEGAVLPLLGVRLPEWDHLVLPAVTLSLVSLGAIARITRASLLETSNAEYLLTAAAKGASALRVFVRHALKNALIPVVTVIGLDFASLLGGAVATEYVFAWPGLGKAIARAIALKDLPLVEGGVLFLTAIFVLVNLGVDMLYVYLDPRIHYGAAS